MRTTMVAASAVVVLAFGSAHAGPRNPCTVLDDPAGDVTVAGLAQFAPDAHLDVRSVALGPAPSTLLVRIRDTDLVERRLGEWRLTFQAGGTKLFVGAGTGMWVNVGEYRGTFGFSAGVVGKRATRVSGTFDYAANEIRVVVPYAAFAGAGRRGTLLTKFQIEAKESYASVTPAGPASIQVPLVDLGESGRSYVLGRSC